jgi:transcriptional regulator with XRE-family HTH domain
MFTNDTKRNNIGEVTEHGNMNDSQAAKLGRLVAEARTRKGFSLRAAAEIAGVPFLWLSRVEHGAFNQPAPERLTRLAEMLEIDPERLDRVTGGHLSSSLPGVRTYLRSKYELTPEEIDQIEQTVNEIQRNHERRDANDNNHDQN